MNDDKFGNGLFWLPGGETRVRGDFVAASGESAEVTLDRSVVDDPGVPAVHTATSWTAIYPPSPEKSVAAFAPIALHGLLDCGEPITLMFAQNYGGSGRLGDAPPRYVARVAVTGAHVTSDQLYAAVRFRIDAPIWTAHLADSAPRNVQDDGSTLTSAYSDDGNWIVYESASPRTLRDLEARVVLGCLVLAQLALDRLLVIRTTEVRVGPDGPWHGLHGRAYGAAAKGFGVSLIPRQELTIERFANWIALNDKLDGLARAVSEPVKGTVQAQILVDTSLVEGLHRRLPYQQHQFPKASNAALKRVKQAARRSAANKAQEEEHIDPDRVHASVSDAVAHFDDVDYRTRAQDLVDEVAAAIPELTESIPDLAGKLTKARNDIAHRLIIDTDRRPLVDRIDQWVVISMVTPWLLRLLLLLHAGFDPALLREACLGCERFAFHRANVTAIIHDPK